MKTDLSPVAQKLRRGKIGSTWEAIDPPRSEKFDHETDVMNSSDMETRPVPFVK